MTLIQDRRSTTSVVRHEDSPYTVATGFFVDSVVGTNAGFRAVFRLQPNVFQLTQAVSGLIAVASDPVSEVRELRQRIASHGISRQEIARGIGVDRRTLSGYASGEIRPAAERLELLHTLADLCDEISSVRPGRVKDLVFGRHRGRALVDQLGDSDVVRGWRGWIAEHESIVTVRPTRTRTEPLWVRAAQAYRDGLLATPTRARTVRPEETYELDPEEAALFEEPRYESRRRGYR